METRAGHFNPNSFSDVPLYNIQAVAAATGVPSITLRSWERRYGVPEPKRDPKGYRLYSERDIAVTRWLRERVHQGVGISRAVNMLHVLEQGELIGEPAPSFDIESLRARLIESIDRMDEAGVDRVIAEALTVDSVENVALTLLQPALQEVGERWATGELSVTAEHVSSNAIRSHLAQLVHISPPPLREERVMIGCAPGELHDIGALMLALFLRRRGFDVVYAGASVEANSFIGDVLRVEPAAVCLSASGAQSVQSLADVYELLGESYGGVLAFGGRAFNESEGLADRVNGLFLGRDAGTATRNLEEALKR